MAPRVRRPYEQEFPWGIVPPTREELQLNMDNYREPDRGEDPDPDDESFIDDPDYVDEGPYYQRNEGPVQGHIWNTDPRMPENFPQLNDPLRMGPQAWGNFEKRISSQMGPNTQQMIDAINRLIAKGMPRDDPTIRSLEQLIEQELAKPAPRDDEFLNAPQRPEVGRPTYQSEPDAPPYTDEQREADRREDLEIQNGPDYVRMYQQYMSNPEGQSGTLSTARGFESLQPMRSFELAPQYGIPNINRGLDFEFDPTQDLSRQRRSFQRPPAGVGPREEWRNQPTPPLTDEELLELSVPPDEEEIEETEY